MILKIHKVLGILLIVISVYIFINLGDYFPGLKAAGDVKHKRVAIGYGVIVLLPFIVSTCFIMPNRLSQIFSPRFGLFQEALLKKYSFIFLGYLLLVIELGLLQLFK